MKILMLDLETSPCEGFTWGPKWKTNIIKFTRYSELLTAAWQWYGEKAIYGVKRKNYKRGTDKQVAKALWKALDKADVVIGHNLKKFDRRVANAIFARHGMPPPSPYQMIDTLTVTRQNFHLPSYKLDDICDYFGLGKKIGTSFPLWEECMKGNLKALCDMLSYNKQDVALLTPLYKFLLPWISSHPNVAQIANRPDACPRCLGTKFRSKGWKHTNTQSYRRFICLSCLGPVRSTEAKKKPKNAKKVMVPV